MFLSPVSILHPGKLRGLCSVMKGLILDTLTKNYKLH